MKVVQLGHSMPRVIQTTISTFTTAILISLLLIQESAAFCNNRADGSQCHPDFIRESLPFLRPHVLNLIAEEVNEPDDGFIDEIDTANHFDACNFDGSIKKINTRYLLPYYSYSPLQPDFAGVIRRLSPFAPASSIQVPEVFKAAAMWGNALHGIHDFYSHSNWVEMGKSNPATDLIDGGLGPWTDFQSGFKGSPVQDNIIATQELSPPSGWNIEFTGDTRVPLVHTDDGRTLRLLITGQTGHPFQHCPCGIRTPGPPNPLCKDVNMLPHGPTTGGGGLHKDNISRIYHEEAANMAKAQTRHEWCRLLHLALEEEGVPAASVPMGLMVSPGASPHPEYTPCASPQNVGPIEVSVQVSNIFVHDDLDDGDNPGDLNLVFTLFTEDFRYSTRTQTDIITIGSGNPIPSEKLPSSQTLCIDPEQRIVATIQGWDDDDEPASRGDLDKDDDILSGVSYSVGKGSEISDGIGTGSFTQYSDNDANIDLQVTFVISSKSTDEDEDGLSLCEELSIGTDPSSSDTDGDGITDGDELDQGNDPLVVDSVFEYTSKIICGFQRDPKNMMLARGFYATAINIHNPNQKGVKIHKKLALTFPPGGQRPGQIMSIGNDKLKYDEALETDCEHIRSKLFQDRFPSPGYIKGFVVIQSSDPLDVISIYTTAHLDQQGETDGHGGIDVERANERIKAGRPLPDLLPIPDENGSFCVLSEGNLLVSIRNRGNLTAKRSSTKIDYFGGAPFSVIGMPAIAPGQTRKLSIPVPKDFRLENFQITADAYGDIDERNEDNNTAIGKCIIVN